MVPHYIVGHSYPGKMHCPNAPRYDSVLENKLQCLMNLCIYAVGNLHWRDPVRLPFAGD